MKRKLTFYFSTRVTLDPSKAHRFTPNANGVPRSRKVECPLVRRLARTALFLGIATTLACQHVTTGEDSTEESNATAQDKARSCAAPPKPYDPTPREMEQDAIYSLLAYAVVYKDWQTADWSAAKNSRGYNIGGVLVDPRREAGRQIMCWGRNSIIKTRNGTQHGEVRMMTNYLHNVERVNAKELKLYTTLEPCAMCSGMMTLQSVKTTIYGQSDPSFGGAIERLTIDSSSVPNGWCPYPRGVQSVASALDVRVAIDDAYSSANMSITKWLTTSEARRLYEQAVHELDGYRVRFGENQKVLDQARAVLETIPDEYVPIPYSVACPPKPNK